MAALSNFMVIVKDLTIEDRKCVWETAVGS